MHGFALLVLIEVAGPALPPADDAPTACEETAASDAIVVCARRRGAGQRLDRAIPAGTEETPLPRAEIGIGGGGRLGISTEQVMIGGNPSNRAMIGIRLPLGGRRRRD